jgi:pimeloyl-ACP methyl ester carboxylesterase
LAGALLVCLTGWGLGNIARMYVHENLPYDAPAPGRGRWVSGRDVQLHITEHGAPEAPVLVLIAGTGAWGGTWVSNIAALTAAGWRVVTIDLPPFGFSQRPASRDYGRTAQAKRLLAGVQAVSQSPVVLLGHSYGGGPAAEAAMLAPAAVRHLILVDAAIGLRTSATEVCDGGTWLSAALGWRPLRTALVANTATQPLFSATLLKQFVARKEAVTEARAALYQPPLKVHDSSAAIGDWAYQFATSCEHSRSHTVKGFSTLTTPLTLLWGELDGITPPQQARDLAAAAGGAPLVLLPGVGHIPQIEDPDDFNTKLAAVLQKLR